MIDLYCERHTAEFWAEPLNAVTNLSFVIAALLAWRLARRHEALEPDVRLLTALVLIIGIGSFLFHTFATGWAMAMDVIPILLFQVSYLWIYGGRIIGLGLPGRSLAVAGLVAAFAVSGQFAQVLNGSLSYLPALLVLAILAAYHYRRAAVARGALLTATGLLGVSLAFRTMDNALCDAVPAGTHLFWHLLNGVVLYLLLKGLVLNLRAAARSPLFR